MAAITEDRPRTAATHSSQVYAALAVVLVSIGVFWPGGRVPLADELVTLVVLTVILRAVTRHPSCRALLAAAPAAAKWAARALLGLFLVAQLWGVSAQTFPFATWTMYSHGPGAEAVVYRFDAVNAEGEPVVFTPSAWNRTLPAKMALVHLRRLSKPIYLSLQAGDDAQVAAGQDLLRRTIEVYIDLHNEQSSGLPPVSVEVSRVAYDVSQDRVPFDSGERTVLLQIDVEAP